MLLILLQLFVVIYCQEISVRQSLFGDTHNIKYNAPTTNVLDVKYTDSSYTKYTVTLNGETWLTSGMTGFRNNGKWVSLQLKEQKNINGQDAFGMYVDFTLIWNDTNNNEYATVVRQYTNEPNIIVFIQSYISGAINASIGNADAVISSFPSFILNNNNLGYIKWGGRQLMNTSIGIFGNANTGNNFY